RHQQSGLRHVLNILRGVEGISFTFFEGRDVVRHKLVQRIVEAYEAGTGDDKGVSVPVPGADT
ncbi:MAG: PhoH family protein, partial [Thiothrix sp.]|nr:PhoH family protein [Thiothrix sp.]